MDSLFSGVIVDEDSESRVLQHTLTLPCAVFMNRECDFTAVVLWKKMNNISLFDIAISGSQLFQEGAIFVFIIGKDWQKYTLVDWILPLYGLGDLMPSSLTSGGNSSYFCPEMPSQQSQYSAVEGVTHSNVYDNNYAEIMMLILQKLKWSNAILIYDDNTEFIVSGKDRHQMDGIFLSTYKISSENSSEDIYKFLKDIYNTMESQLSVVVVGDTKMMERLMTEVNTFDDKRARETSMTYHSRWFLFHVDSTPLTDVDFLSNLNNVAVVNLPLNRMTLDMPTYLTLQFIIEHLSTNDEVIEALYHADELGQRCLNGTLITKVQNEIRNISHQARKAYAEIVRFPIMTLKFRKSGRQWSNVGQVSLNGSIGLHSDIFPNVRYGFNGKLFIVSTIEAVLFFQLFPFEYVDNGTWKGLCIDLLNELSRDLNFTYQIVTSPDGEWGRFVNKSWTGMIGQLERREVDLTVTPLSIQEERERVMDFTMGFFVDTLLIIMKKPDPNKTKWLRLVKPLRWEVMLLTGFLIPIISTFLFLAEKFNPYYKHDLKIAALPEFLWYCFGCVFMQGGSNLPDSQTGRSILSCWWFFCIILSATYCGNLIAYLTVPIEKLPFNSPAAMLEQKEYEWGTMGGTYFQMFFEHSDNPTNQAVWQGIVAFNQTDKRVLSNSEKDHMQKVKEGQYAYIAEKSYLEAVVSEDCDLGMTKEEILTLQYGVGLSNNSPYTKIFSDSILYILESGLIQIWKQKHWPKQNFCAGSLLTEAKPIMWIDIQIAFYFLGGGVFLGVIVLFGEQIIRKYKDLKTRLRGGIIPKSDFQAENGVSTNP
ncbi:unnamed protein product [Mytilus edulis]|uniref:Uncharacterized protein n=1 Tax=Mytilus edulis TaxID=6550 RepID=A0A8S3RF49_MYTED|nr:unnamed protein product [Mytilus edulis]